jgi:hypothetical protein
MPYNTTKVSQAAVQVAHTPTSDNSDGVDVSQLAVQVAHTGGGGTPAGANVSQLGVQIAHGPTGDLPTAIHISQLGIQVAYVETYPNIPLTGYSPRLLVDILFASGIQRFTTEDTYVEEI